MSNLKERLDHLRNLIQDDDFLTGKGLSNEVNIHIFCYDAKDELTVQHFMEQIKTDQSLVCRPIVCNLYTIFLSICDDLDIMDAIHDMEDSDCDTALLNELNNAIGASEFVEKMQGYPHEKGNVLMIIGVGDVFPFMRVHTLLAATAKLFSNIPTLVLYPGEFDGYHLKLFNRLQPNDCYMAFNVI